VSWLGEITDFGPAPLAVNVYWESYPGKKAHIWRLWQQSGWLQVARVSLETPVSSHQEVISYFCNDMGQPLPAWLGNRLFDMRSSVPTYMHHEPPEELEEQADALYWDFLGRCDRKNLAELERGEDRLNDDIHAKEGMALGGVSQIDDYISSLRREKRHPDCALSRKAEIDDRIADVEKYKPQLLAALPDEIEALRRDYEALEQDTFESITFHGRIETLYTVRWTMCSRHQPPPVNVSLWTEERFMGNLNVGTKWKEHLRAGHRIDVSLDQPNAIRTKREVKRALAKQDNVKANAPNSTESNKRGRPVGSTNIARTVSPVTKPKSFSGAEASLAKSAGRQAKRETRQQLSSVLNKHGTLSELKYVRAFLKGKTGADLKVALIHLAKHDFMSTDDAVYLFKVLSALKPKKSK
jgi:phage host-nuclease inhibitor protein Gam